MIKANSANKLTPSKTEHMIANSCKYVDCMYHHPSPYKSSTVNDHDRKK